MLSNVQDILKAKGAQLEQPLAFGPYTGMKLNQVPVDYFERLAGITGVPVSRFQTILKKLPAETLTRQTRPIPECLRPYQRRYVEGVVTRVGDEPYRLLIGGIGIGKTFCGLGTLASCWEPGHTAAVFTRLNNVDDWENCITEFFPDFTYVAALGSSYEKISLLGLPRHIYILNHEAVLSDDVFRTMVEKKFDWVIVDESHKIKTPSAKITKRFIELSSSIPRRFTMTGTPITGKELDAWAQITFCDRGKRFGNHWTKFRKRFFTKDYMGWNWELSQNTESEFLTLFTEVVDIITREEALPDLPPKSFQTREVELKGEALKTYQDYQARAMVVLGQDTDVVRHKVVEILRLAQVAGGGVNSYRFKEQGKLDELNTILDQADGPVVIVSRFTHEILAIEALLESRGMTHGSIRGSVPKEERKALKAEFSAGRMDAIILQEQAGAEGLNGLQNHCNLMVFFSRSYSWEKRDQMEGRISRSGQTRPCLYIDLVAVMPGGIPTIDHAIMEVLENKETRVNYIFDTVKKVLSK